MSDEFRSHVLAIGGAASVAAQENLPLRRVGLGNEVGGRNDPFGEGLGDLPMDIGAAEQPKPRLPYPPPGAADHPSGCRIDAIRVINS
jgi:hypothetical protein